MIVASFDGGCDGSSDDDNYEDYDDHEYEDSTTDRRNRRWVGAIRGTTLVGMEKGGEALEVNI